MPVSRTAVMRPGKTKMVGLKRPPIYPQQAQVRAGQGEGAPWTKVERKKKKKPQDVHKRRDTRQRKRRRAGAKHEKGDALVIKTDQSKYSEVLKAMMSDTQLVDLGAGLRSIRRTLTGEMILKLKCDKKRKGIVYINLADEVFVEGVEVKVINL